MAGPRPTEAASAMLTHTRVFGAPEYLCGNGKPVALGLARAVFAAAMLRGWWVGAGDVEGAHLTAVLSGPPVCVKLSRELCCSWRDSWRVAAVQGALCGAWGRAFSGYLVQRRRLLGGIRQLRICAVLIVDLRKALHRDKAHAYGVRRRGLPTPPPVLAGSRPADVQGQKRDPALAFWQLSACCVRPARLLCRFMVLGERRPRRTFLLAPPPCRAGS